MIQFTRTEHVRKFVEICDLQSITATIMTKEKKEEITIMTFYDR